MFMDRKTREFEDVRSFQLHIQHSTEVPASCLVGTGKLSLKVLRESRRPRTGRTVLKEKSKGGGRTPPTSGLSTAVRTARCRWKTRQ